MPTTHASVAVGAATGAGLSTVTLLLGAQVDALVIGLIAAVFVSIWLETIDSKVKAAAAVLFAAMLAGYGSPVAAQWVVANVPDVAGNQEALSRLLALVIGASSPSVVPRLIKWLGRKAQS